jgi:hypothetical protein
MEANALAVKKPHPNLRWFAELQPEPGTSKPWIRILRLKAGAFEDPIHGHLEVEELDAADPFDALSYCCGPDILSCSITINNTPEFRITENLWTALQRVRKKDGDRRLWTHEVNCIAEPLFSSSPLSNLVIRSLYTYPTCEEIRLCGRSDQNRLNRLRYM